MKKFSMIVLALVIFGIPLIFASAQPSAAQVERAADMAISQVDEGLAADNDAAQEVGQFGDDAAEFDDDEFDADEVKNKKVEAVFEFDGMVGNEASSGDIAGVLSAGRDWTIEDGKASLNEDFKLEVDVEGLMFSDGESAEGRALGAGVACMDSGFFKAVANDDADEFTLDADGNASFEGTADFMGNSCVGPTVLVTVVNQEGDEAWVAASGFSVMAEDVVDDDADDDDDDDDDNDDE